MTETANPIDEILAEAENPAFVRVTTAKVLLRQDLVARHEQLDAELSAVMASDAMENITPRAPAIAAELRDLEDEIEAAKREFKFRSIGHRAWADLLAAHPPTREQRKADARLDHDPTSFPLAAIAASCVDPVLTFESVARLEVALISTQFDLLWARCIEANVGLADPKSLAAGAILRVSEQYAITPAPAASPAPSSSTE